MTIDEVIAQNVRRIRKDRGLSIQGLAKVLGVGSHVVYDYERPRRGQPQRGFTWADLVGLCFALHTTLFELVLPDEGEVLDDVRPGRLELRARAVEVGADDLAGTIDADSRAVLGWALFGFKPSLLAPQSLALLPEKWRGELDRRADVMLSITEEIWKRLDEKGLTE